MRVEVDTPKCVASGQCVLIAPDVFDQRDEDGRVVLLTNQVEHGQATAVQEAASVCPAAVIRLVED
jgi:ferredoxin